MQARFNNIGIEVYKKGTDEKIFESDGVVKIQDNIPSEKEIKKRKYNDTHVIAAFKKERFVKVFDEAMPILLELLNPIEFKFTMGIITLISYNDCILRRGGHGNGKILTTKEIAEELKMEYGTVRRIIPKLKKYGIIGVHETGSISADIDSKITRAYTANPFIYARGNDFNKTIYSFYEATGWSDIHK